MQDDVTPLDTYVHGDDGYYSYEYLTEYEYPGVTVYVVNMTSQKYQDGLSNNHITFFRISLECSLVGVWKY
jgi:hypothetical protein